MKIVVAIRLDGQTSLDVCEQAALALGDALSESRPETTTALLLLGVAEPAGPVAEVARHPAGERVSIFTPALDETDYEAYARVLAAACRHLGFDLILVPARTADEDLDAAGPAAAHHLGIPHLTAVETARWLPDGKIAAQRREDRGLRTLAVPTPALLTVRANALLEPAGAPPASGPDAAAASFLRLDLAALGLLAEELRPRRGLRGTPAEATDARPEQVPDVAALVRRLRAGGWW
jgi:electron transfer flavoprotein beta subunit